MARTGNNERQNELSQEAEIDAMVTRVEFSNTMFPIQRNDSSNTQSAQRNPAHRIPQMKQSGRNFVQRNPQMEKSGKNSDLSTWHIVGRRSSSEHNRRMLTRRGNRELTVAGTSTVLGNLNGVQRIMDIWTKLLVK